VLVAARAVQGIGAALLSPAALALVTVIFPAGRERNIALGIWGALAGIGGTLGVVAGGVLVDGFGWEWIFFVNLPVAALALVATPLVVGESRPRADRRALRPRRRRAGGRPGRRLPARAARGSRDRTGEPGRGRVHGAAHQAGRRARGRGGGGLIARAG
jgi:MFS family permease